MSRPERCVLSLLPPPVSPLGLGARVRRAGNELTCSFLAAKTVSQQGWEAMPTPAAGRGGRGWGESLLPLLPPNSGSCSWASRSLVRDCRRSQASSVNTSLPVCPASLCSWLLSHAYPIQERVCMGFRTCYPKMWHLGILSLFF